MENKIEDLKNQIENFNGDKRKAPYKKLKQNLKELVESNLKPSNELKDENNTLIPKETKEVLNNTQNENGDELEMRKALIEKHRNFYGIELITKDEINILKEFFKPNKNEITREEQVKLYGVYNRLFNKRRKPSSCSSCVIKIVDILRKVYDHYS